MIIEGQYLTYAEYLALGGSAIGEMPFKLLEFEARRIVDINTHNRLKNVQEIPQEVKICEYNLINNIQKFANSTINSSGNISSENTDRYSVSYITADKISEIVKSKQSELKDIVRTYLLGVIANNEHIMYAGVK